MRSWQRATSLNRSVQAAGSAALGTGPAQIDFIVRRPGGAFHEIQVKGAQPRKARRTRRGQRLAIANS